VWRISKSSVVKVYNPNFGKALLPYIWDEIRGSKRIKNALPIKGLVDVVLPNGIKTIGLVKRYIPYPINNNEKFYDLYSSGAFGNSWDIHNDNIRVDEKGKYWVTDTQTHAVNYIEEKLEVNPWRLPWPGEEQ
jgi:hypothetical protein